MSEETKKTTRKLKGFVEVEGYISLKELREQNSTRNTADFNRGIVTSRHSYERKFAATIPADLITIGGKFRFFEKDGKTPAYGWMRIRSVNINLRNGVKPNPDGSVTGLVEMKVRDHTKKGQREEIYVYLNVYPLPEGEAPEFELTINAVREKPQDGEVHFGPTVGTRRKVSNARGNKVHYVYEEYKVYVHLKPPNN